MATIYGGNGHNLINDTAGDDVIYAGGGGDIVNITSGQDYVDGGGDTDVLNVLWGAATQDIYFYSYSSAHGYVNTGTNYDDSTWRVGFISMEHLRLTAGAGDDYIQGNYGQWDAIDGGAGVDFWEDSFSTAGGGMTVNMIEVQSNIGQSWADGSSVKRVEHVHLTLTEFDDTFRDFGMFDDVVYGGSGDDDVGHVGGRDYFYGGSGMDTLRLFWGNATQDSYVNNASDTVAYVNTHTHSGDSTRFVDFASVENLVVYFGRGDDDFFGGAGDDYVQGGVGADSLNGGGGIDTAAYASSNAGVEINLTTGMLSGGHATGDTLDGFENLVGSAHGDTLTGNAGANTLFGGAGNDRLFGGGGSDTIDGGAGRDLVHMGNGNDVFIDNSHAATGGNDKVYGGNGHDVFNGDGGNDSFYGGAGTDTLYGGAEHDFLAGGQGDDHLEGGFGNDRLFGGLGHDLLDGGQGNDTANYNGSTGGVTANLGNSGVNGGAALGDTFASIENLVGTAHSDVLVGDNLSNDLVGLGGADSLYGAGSNDLVNGGGGNDLVGGGDGNDIVVGNVGNDMVYGGNGHDTLFGGAGDDYLLGGNHKDTLNGGAGADTFDFNALSHSTPGADRDVVQGFSSAAGDKVDLQTIDANTTVEGNQAFTFIGNAGFSGVAGELRFAVGSSGFLSGDVNGDMLADFTIEFTVLTSMTAGDIIL